MRMFLLNMFFLLMFTSCYNKFYGSSDLSVSVLEDSNDYIVSIKMRNPQLPDTLYYKDLYTTSFKLEGDNIVGRIQKRVRPDYNLYGDSKKEYGNSPVVPNKSNRFLLKDDQVVILYLHNGQEKLYKLKVNQ